MKIIFRAITRCLECPHGLKIRDGALICCNYTWGENNICDYSDAERTPIPPWCSLEDATFDYNLDLPLKYLKEKDDLTS